MNGLAVASLVVLAVVSVLWTIMMVIVTSELRRASGRLQEFIRSLELELKPTIQQAREAIRTLNRVAQGAAEGTERVRGTLAKLDAAGDNIRATTRVVRSVVGARLIPVASLVAGVRVGANVLWKLSTQRRRRHE
jgi:predicted Holliday junction resolvase-like endonuclease